jgi:co-chaperonin GroES (HSP10)
MKKIIVLGDRVLIKPDNTEEKTQVGLYLPQTVKEREEVQRGYIVKTGPGIPLADSYSIGDEPWHRGNETTPRYIPMEARVNDYALFLRKAAVEIKYENEVYFVIPQSAILLLIRENRLPEIDEEDPLIDF